jgi:putative phosphoserine phosphatase/1-acylglycerol-3-phosphate O-acyltransferase
MQAGVPVIPIVIYNSGDVAPKGDFVFRPAIVNVEVLPPVDTSAWSADTIDDHVREVRNMFARTLGQPQEQPVKPKAKSRRAPVKRKKATGKSPTKKKQKQ